MEPDGTQVTDRPAGSSWAGPGQAGRPQVEDRFIDQAFIQGRRRHGHAYHVIDASRPAGRGQIILFQFTHSEFSGVV